MEKILKKLFDFVKNNVIRVILAVLLLSFNYIYFKEIINPNIQLFIEKILKIKWNESHGWYLFFYSSIGDFVNILKISIIYLILFGGKKIEVDDCSEKVLVKGKKIKRFLILILILIALSFLNYIVSVTFNGENMQIFENTFISHFEDWEFEGLPIEKKLKILFIGISYLLIKGILLIFIILNLLSVFTILDDKGESNFSVVNMLEHFSKTVSKKVAIFISHIFIMMDYFLVQRGSTFLKNNNAEIDFTINYFHDYSNLLETPSKFLSIIVIFGVVLLFILIKIILESNEMLATTKALKNKNIKYYLTNFFYILLTQGVTLVLIGYIIDNTNTVSFLTIFVVFPTLFSIFLSLELLVYKINFKYLGENVKIDFDKFLNLIVISFGLYFLNLIVLSVFWSVLWAIANVTVFLILGGFVLFINFYIAFIFFTMKSFSILREDKKVTLKLVTRFVNLDALIIIVIVLSYVLVSEIFKDTYTNLNPVFCYIIFFLIKCYINLVLCDYYLRVTKEEIKTDDKNIEIENIEEKKTEVIVEKENNGENLS